MCEWGWRRPDIPAGSSDCWQSCFEVWIGDPAEIRAKRDTNQDLGDLVPSYNLGVEPICYTVSEVDDYHCR